MNLSTTSPLSFVVDAQCLGACRRRDAKPCRLWRLRISVFAAKGLTVDELAQASPLVRFESLTLMTVGAIRQAGLAIEPTGRNPLHYDVTFRDLAAGIESLLGCSHTVFHNPYFED